MTDSGGGGAIMADSFFLSRIYICALLTFKAKE